MKPARLVLAAVALQRRNLNFRWLIDGMNANRPFAKRTGTGYFVSQAAFLFQQEQEAAACAILEQMQPGMTHEARAGELDAEAYRRLVEDVTAIHESSCR